MELLLILGAALIGLLVVWKLLTGIIRTVALVAILVVIGGFVLANGGFL